MIVEKSSLVRKAFGQTCDIYIYIYIYIYNQIIDEKQIEESDFEYSKTKRGDVWVHSHCWIKLYGGREQ